VAGAEVTPALIRAGRVVLTPQHVVKVGTAEPAVHRAAWTEDLRVEAAVYRLLAGSGLPIPTVVDEGGLGLVATRLPGTSVDGAAMSLTLEDWEELARALGAALRVLHARDGATIDRRLAGAAPSVFTARVPHHLRREAADLVATTASSEPWRAMRPSLLHCDVHGGNVLVEPCATGWRFSGLVDFGRACTGVPLFDVMLAQARVLHHRRALMRAFLDDYGAASGQQWPQLMMACALLHPFDVVTPALRRWPSLNGAQSIGELACALWDTRPGE
jgi:hygromycin-B 7''-O-kinase